ncbi:MAG: asparagine synthetase B [Sphingomonadales bacterium]|nr:MAG: asparagine synthetase B [Sphingomonadales bacterium]
MTALAGYWGFGSDGAPDAQVRRMLDGQRQFGEDDPAIATLDTLAIGRRFSVLLPEDVHDRGPQRSEDGRFALVADVRLDNRDALAAALAIDARELPLLCDAAMLLRAWAHWEEASLQHLVGDFAFALWDSQRRRLVLARDFLGQRPLCYASGPGFFAFASMPSGLHSLPQVPYAPATAQLSRFLALSPYAGAETFFEGVERVQPGHFAVISEAGVDQSCYWHPPLDPIRLPSPDDYVDAVRAHIERAVADRLRGGEDRLASHLSAGLDSSVVTGCAAALLAPAGITAFTAAPREGTTLDASSGKITDESIHAALTAGQHPNLRHVVVRDKGVDLEAALDRTYHLYQRPVPNLCNYGWTAAINDTAKARGLRVLLTGDAGNLGFSHSGMELLPQLLRTGRWLRLAKLFRRLRATGVPAKGLMLAAGAPLLPHALWRRFRLRRGEPTTLAEFSLARQGDPEAKLDFTEQPYHDALAARMRAYRTMDPGNFNKGIWGGWGLDVRDPMADRRLVEFCLRIPSEIFLMHGIPRGLAREVARAWVPATVAAEQRRGFQSADWRDWLKSQRAAIADETVRMENVGPAEAAIDLERARKLLEDWPGEEELARPATARLYRAALPRAVSAGHFARRASRSNA